MYIFIFYIKNVEGRLNPKIPLYTDLKYTNGFLAVKTKEKGKNTTGNSYV